MNASTDNEHAVAGFETIGATAPRDLPSIKPKEK